MFEHENDMYGNKQNLRNFANAMISPGCMIFDYLTDWSKFEQILCVHNITPDRILQYDFLE